MQGHLNCLEIRDFTGCGGGDGRYWRICFDCRHLDTYQVSRGLNEDLAVDIPAHGDDDRSENMHARFSVLLEEAQGFTEREGGVKALEHLILFLLQMSSKVK